VKTSIPVNIYVLYDPRECKVRYIGRTTKVNIKHRLIEHITKARYHNVYYPGKNAPHRTNWINNLLSEGVNPCIKLICVVKGWSESHVVEQCLINRYKQTRNLTNCDDRGEGNLNRIVTDNDKLNISNSLKTYYETNINNKAKEICVYDLEGTYVSMYPSATAFADFLGVPTRHVTRVASGTYGRRQVKGFQVKYSDSDRNVVLMTRIPRKPVIILMTRKPLIVFNRETKELIHFTGINEACSCLNIKRHQYTGRRKRGKRIIIGQYEFFLAQDKSDELLELLQREGTISSQAA